MLYGPAQINLVNLIAIRKMVRMPFQRRASLPHAFGTGIPLGIATAFPSRPGRLVATSVRLGPPRSPSALSPSVGAKGVGIEVSRGAPQRLPCLAGALSSQPFHFGGTLCSVHSAMVHVGGVEVGDGMTVSAAADPVDGEEIGVERRVEMVKVVALSDDPEGERADEDLGGSFFGLAAEVFEAAMEEAVVVGRCLSLSFAVVVAMSRAAFATPATVFVTAAGSRSTGIPSTPGLVIVIGTILRWSSALWQIPLYSRRSAARCTQRIFGCRRFPTPMNQRASAARIGIAILIVVGLRSETVRDNGKNAPANDDAIRRRITRHHRPIGKGSGGSILLRRRISLAIGSGRRRCIGVRRLGAGGSARRLRFERGVVVVVLPRARAIVIGGKAVIATRLVFGARSLAIVAELAARFAHAAGEAFAAAAAAEGLVVVVAAGGMVAAFFFCVIFFAARFGTRFVIIILAIGAAIADKALSLV
mmetsp:Transcript_13927/g.29730  ORF Transcript_13927/g.29730 Transcript_13927/m.29730 type:complete len:475 (-) Transcript_13927:85-1509(-)